MTNIPTDELRVAAQFILSISKDLTADRLEDLITAAGAHVSSSVDSTLLLDEIASHIESKKPLSAIRLGDGEANIFTFGERFDTPSLDEHCFREIVAMQKQKFAPSPMWMMAVKNMLAMSIMEADIIGIRGLASFKKPTASTFQPQEHLSIETVASQLEVDPRGTWGYWRGIDYIRTLAERSLLHRKKIVSAHFYISVINNISDLKGHIKRTIFITNRPRGARYFAEKMDVSDFEIIDVSGSRKDSEKSRPHFLIQMEQKLPVNLSGTLCLIGAGPWSEIYCSMIKRRGGVAVDIGSGFDLAAGMKTRPIHDLIEFDR